MFPLAVMCELLIKLLPLMFPLADIWPPKWFIVTPTTDPVKKVVNPCSLTLNKSVLASSVIPKYLSVLLLFVSMFIRICPGASNIPSPPVPLLNAKFVVL